MTSNAIGSLLWFIAIVAMIPVALWLLKRSPAGARFTGTPGVAALRSVATLPLAANQRVVTIEVGRGAERRWLVLGVTAQTITTLHTMAPQDDGEAPPPPPLGFAQLLGRLRQARETPDAH